MVQKKTFIGIYIAAQGGARCLLCRYKKSEALRLDLYTDDFVFIGDWHQSFDLMEP